MHPLVQLAKETIEKYVVDGKAVKAPSEPSPEMKEKAGVFVSLKKKGELRGCIGTFSPTEENVAQEIIRNAVSAATQDPRFPPVRPSELNEIDYSVDVLSPPEKVKGRKGLDPKRYGVIVSSGRRRGLLLPDLEGVDTVDEQLSIACMKAGISSSEEFEIMRFEVKRYK
ncbi:MAG: AmmeMemoRadiSam system protein A [Nitrospirae bacterium]|nr:AmmeMemoRadiSam system protein A [Nitrospirota bacterium]